MNYKRPLVAGLSLALASVSAIAHTALYSTEAAFAEVAVESIAAPDETIAAALAQEIAQLEVERVLLGVTYASSAPVFAPIDERQQDLKASLDGLQPSESQALIEAATVSAVAAKITELEAVYTTNQDTYTDANPEQQYLQTAISDLRQHLATLQ
jgi:Skp family chaperone for outer membrane proteins